MHFPSGNYQHHKRYITCSLPQIYQELLSVFQKIQKLEPQQLNIVKDFISAYLLKADLQKHLADNKWLKSRSECAAF
jgi:hypothetical protein